MSFGPLQTPMQLGHACVGYFACSSLLRALHAAASPPLQRSVEPHTRCHPAFAREGKATFTQPRHMHTLQEEMQQVQFDALVVELARTAAGEAAITARVAAVAAEAERMHGARARRESDYIRQREADWQAALEQEGRLVRCAFQPTIDSACLQHSTYTASPSTMHLWIRIAGAQGRQDPGG